MLPSTDVKIIEKGVFLRCRQNIMSVFYYVAHGLTWFNLPGSNLRALHNNFVLSNTH